MAISIEYIPTPKQRLFHETTANEVLYGGAAGGGKSKAIVMDALARCLMWPDTHAYCFRRTYPELEDTLIREARRSYPEGLGTYNAGRREYRLLNGSMIHFRHCATPDDMNAYRGVEIQWLYIDELTTFTEDIYNFLKTRLRATKQQGMVPIVRCASNPGDIGHGWVKARFVDSAPYGEQHDEGAEDPRTGLHKPYWVQYIPALATDNPYISDEYVAELARKPEALRRALLNGDWDAFEGQVFVEWKNDPAHYGDRRWTHVIEPFTIPDHWPRYMSFDHGYTKPFSVGWWAIGPNGCAYRYREWYGCERGQANKGLKLTPREIAEGIVAREREHEALENIYVARYADPAIFDKSRGLSVADQMEPINGQTGVFFEKGDNERIAGKMQIHERLRFDPSGLPRLQVFTTCEAFIRTVPNLPYDSKKPEDIDTDAEDHCYDETRYFCMANPLPLAEKKPIPLKPFDPLADEEDNAWKTSRF